MLGFGKHFILNVDCIEIESTSTIIKESIQMGLGTPKSWEKFAQWLGFNSNVGILAEIVAL